MRVALITPNWRRQRGPFGTDTSLPPVSFPIEWGYLNGEQRTQAMQIELFDDYATNASPGTIGQRCHEQTDYFILSTAPSYLFWRCPPLSLDLVTQYTKQLQQTLPGRVVIVGPHGTVRPEETLQATTAHYVCRGEVDPQLLEVLSSIAGESGRPVLASNGTPGQLLPESALTGRQVLYPQSLDGYEPHTWLPACREQLRGLGGSFALLETARGCSYDCGFCLRAGFRQKLRLKDLVTLESELQQLTEREVSYVYLIDETFGLPWEHAVAVLALLRKYGMAFGCQTRPEIWSPDRLQMLASSGCLYLEVGTESLTSAGLAAGSKFRDVGLVEHRTQEIVSAIEHVGINILDVGNPDLSLLSRSAALAEHDNDMRPPPAFIPYPGTRWGEDVLRDRGLQGSWNDAELLFLSYSLGSKNWILRRFFLNSVGFRRLVLHISRLGRSVGLRRMVRTRYGSPFRPGDD